jgi:hypothetical protein
MLLKGRYLTGHTIDKDVFRKHLEAGERLLFGRKISGITPLSDDLLKSFPLESWETTRSENFWRLRGSISDAPGWRILEPADRRQVPFTANFLFDTGARRDQFREELIARDVYPAVLWPLDAPAVDGIPAEHMDLAARMFSIPVDMRYGPGDMARIARIWMDLVEEHG